MASGISRGCQRRGKSYLISLHKFRGPTLARTKRAGGPFMLMGLPDNQEPASVYN